MVDKLNAVNGNSGNLFPSTGVTSQEVGKINIDWKEYFQTNLAPKDVGGGYSTMGANLGKSVRVEAQLEKYADMYMIPLMYKPANDANPPEPHKDLMAIAGQGFDKDGVIERDANGNVTKKLFIHDGQIKGYSECKYDAEGNQTKNDCYDAAGNLRVYSESKYDYDGNMIERIQYYPDGSIRQSELNDCDKESMVERTMRYNGDGGLEYLRIDDYVVQVTSSGIEIPYVATSVHYDMIDGGRVCITQRDPDTNVIKSINYYRTEDNGTRVTEERRSAGTRTETVTYYSEDGRFLERTEETVE